MFPVRWGGHWFHRDRRGQGAGEERGESKGALAANTSWWLLFRGVRASALAIGARERGRDRGRHADRRSTCHGSRGIGNGTAKEDSSRDFNARDPSPMPIVVRRDSPIAGARTALMSGGAKVTWSPHTCAYNRKRSLFHYKSVY